MRILLTVALMFVFMISKAQTSNFSETNISLDGGQSYLTTGAYSSAALYSASLYNYNSFAALSQRWSLVNGKLQCKRGPGIYIYVVITGTALNSTLDSTVAANWVLGSNNSGLSIANSNPPQYLASSATGATLSSTPTAVTLTAPLYPFQVDQVYSLTCSDYAFSLVAGLNNAPATTIASPGIGSYFVIRGYPMTNMQSYAMQSSPNTVTINMAQIVSNSLSPVYLINNVTCSTIPNPGYNWSVVDNGDGTITLTLLSLVDGSIQGILTCSGGGGLSVAPASGTGQKWVYRKKPGMK